MDPRCFEALIVVCTAGFLLGCQLGYPSLAMQVTREISDCSRYSNAGACGRVGPVCFWNATNVTGAFCAYTDQTAPCFLITDMNACEADPKCVFRDNVCQHDRPWTPAQEGMFIASGFLGTMISAFGTGFALSFISHPKYLVAVGLVGMISVAILAISWQTSDPENHQISTVSWLLVGRILGGVGNGMLKVAAPLYAGAKARSAHRDKVIIAFEVANPIAGFLLGLVVYTLNRTVNSDNQHEWFHVVHALLCTAAVALIVASCIVTPVASKADAKASAATPLMPSSLDEDDDPGANPITPTWLAFVAGLLLPIGLQASGAQIIMSFAPTLAKEMGLAPLTGTLVLLLWNMIAALMALVVNTAGVRPPIMLVIGLSASAAFSLLNASATSPWLFPDDESQVASCLMIFGLFGTLGTFRLWLVPSFAVVIQRIFPPTWRPIGTSVSMSFNSLCTIVILWAYPTVVDTLASDQGDERRGQSVIFVCFGLVSASCALLSYLLVRHVV